MSRAIVWIEKIIADSFEFQQLLSKTDISIFACLPQLCRCVRACCRSADLFFNDSNCLRQVRRKWQKTTFSTIVTTWLSRQVAKSVLAASDELMWQEKVFAIGKVKIYTRDKKCWIADLLPGVRVVAKIKSILVCSTLSTSFQSYWQLVKSCICILLSQPRCQSAATILCKVDWK